MVVKWSLILLMTLSGCASWTPTDTKYEIAFQLVNAADAYTTSRIVDEPYIREGSGLTRSVLGEQPEDVALLFITYGIGHYMIARALPEKWRRLYQVSTIGYSTYLVVENCNNGLCP